MTTLAQDPNWAKNIGLPDCIGVEYAAEHGGQLPNTLQELDSWGSATGRRTASGWRCLGGSSGGSTPPPSGGGGGILPGGDTNTTGIYKFIETNWPLLAGAGVLYLLLKRK